jgi:hypothetical protein
MQKNEDKLILSRAELRALLAHASKDQTRPHLYGLFIAVDAGFVAATDGHRLAVVRADEGVTDWGNDKGHIIARSAIETAVKVARAKGEITFSAEPNGVTIEAWEATAGIGRATYSAAWGRVEATYPPIRQVIPAYWHERVETQSEAQQRAARGEEVQQVRESAQCWGANGKYVAEAIELVGASSDYDRGNVIISGPTTPLDPFVVHNRQSTTFVVIMPVRV